MKRSKAAALASTSVKPSFICVGAIWSTGTAYIASGPAEIVLAVARIVRLNIKIGGREGRFEIDGAAGGHERQRVAGIDRCAGKYECLGAAPAADRYDLVAAAGRKRQRRA